VLDTGYWINNLSAPTGSDSVVGLGILDAGFRCCGFYIPYDYESGFMFYLQKFIKKLPYQHPASSIQHPASSIQHPASSIQHPASSIQHPASSIQHLTLTARTLYTH
jgi:hypothetical protein